MLYLHDDYDQYDQYDHQDSLFFDGSWTLTSSTGCDIIADEFLTLQAMLDEKLQDHWDKVDEVSVGATKQYGLEMKLKGLMEEWSEMDIMIKPYKESGTFIIGGTDDIYAMLDDQIVMAQTMLASPFIKYIKGPTAAFEKRLIYLQETLDAWLMVQRTWMYLKPIFGSEDIMRQMPTEGRRFAAVDGFWRRTFFDGPCWLYSLCNSLCNLLCNSLGNSLCNSL